MNIKKKRIIFIIFLIILFITSSSLTYAYFSVFVEGNDDVSGISNDTARLELTFSDSSNNISLPSTFPGATASKTFIISNTGTTDAAYNLIWQSLTNQIVNNELYFTATCTAYDNYLSDNNPSNVLAENSDCGYLRDVVGSSADAAILSMVPINYGEIHVYNFDIEFIETNDDQNYNQGKVFYGTLGIETGSDETTIYGQLLDSSNNAISNATITTHSNPITTVTDENGYFSLEGIEYGEHNIDIVSSDDIILGNGTFSLVKTNNTPSINSNVINWNGVYKKTDILKTHLGSGATIDYFSIEPIFTNTNCFKYTALLSSATITDYYDYESNNSANASCPRDVNIPTTLGGKTVKIIGISAFANSNLTSVVLPNTITTILSHAFDENKLINISIPSSVTLLETNSFANNRLTDLTLPTSITKVKNSAFENNFIANLTLSPNTKSIGINAFKNNRLTSVNLPNSITSIDDGAFQLNRLTSINIPSGIESIESESFRNNKLTIVTIPSTIEKIELNAFSDNLLRSVIINGKASSSDFDDYASTIWGWDVNTTCTINNISNVANGCILWNQ